MLKNMQGRLKESGRSVGLWILKALSGFFVGLTIALIMREIASLGQFTFLFVIVAIVALFLRLSGSWKLAGVLLFDLFCVMTAMLLRMYIMVAPGT